MTKDQVKFAYFEWLVSMVCCDDDASKKREFSKLFYRLHETEFTYTIPMDANRAEDGTVLRYRFGSEKLFSNESIRECLDDQPCSLLEMMVALSNRCESHIMGDPEVGNRTGRWFWNMISNLGLSKMDNQHFNDEYVDPVLVALLNRRYGRRGEGGLFFVKNRPIDLRTVDIWYQMCWYLDELLEWENIK